MQVSAKWCWPLLMVVLMLSGCGGTSSATPVNSGSDSGSDSGSGDGTDDGTDDGSDDTDGDDSGSVSNVAPVASAGRDQSALAGSTLYLPGSGLDSDGTIAAYEWQQLDGTAAVINNPSAATTTVVLPAVTASEVLVFALTVTDNNGATDTDTVNITLYVEADSASNVKPVASAGSDQIVTSGDTVTLMGTGSDYDGVVLSYAWQQVTGTSVTLTDSSAATLTFTAPDVIAQETLVFALVVTDDEGATDADTVNVRVYPEMSAPSNLVVAASLSGFTLTWDAVSGADSYNLYYAAESFGSPVDVDNYASLVAGHMVTGIADNEYVLTSPDTITTYYFAVTAVRDADESSASSEVSSTSVVTITIGATGLLNDTGLDTCSNLSAGGSECPVTDFEGQDGDYGRDATALAGTLTKTGGGEAGFDFIKLDADGNTLDAAADDWACVFDVRTGLVWEVKAAASTSAYSTASTFTWYSTDSAINGGNAGTSATTKATDSGSCVLGDDVICQTSNYVDYVNSQSLCGLSSWRLPTVRELTGIVDHGAEAPSIDSDYFPNAVYNKSYWTRETGASGAWSAWSVSFNTGTAATEAKSVARPVRLVAGEEE